MSILNLKSEAKIFHFVYDLKTNLAREEPTFNSYQKHSLSSTTKEAIPKHNRDRSLSFAHDLKIRLLGGLSPTREIPGVLHANPLNLTDFVTYKI